MSSDEIQSFATNGNMETWKPNTSVRFFTDHISTVELVTNQLMTSDSNLDSKVLNKSPIFSYTELKLLLQM